MESNYQNSALLVMDMQAGILGRYPDASEILKNVAHAIEKARHQNLQVIFVRVGFRNGFPEISPNNKFFAMMSSLTNVDMDQWMKIDASIEPTDEDIIVTKRRISAFAGSDLEVVLRAKGIQHLVLTGLSSSGVVLSTLREAADKDYKLTVLSDCCADGDMEVHNVLMNKIFPRQAEVLKVGEWMK